MGRGFPKTLFLLKLNFKGEMSTLFEVEEFHPRQRTGELDRYRSREELDSFRKMKEDQHA